MSWRRWIGQAAGWPGFVWAAVGMAAMQGFFSFYPVFRNAGDNLVPGTVSSASGWQGLDRAGVSVAEGSSPSRFRLTATPGQRPAVEYPLTGWGGADAILVEGRCRADGVRRGEQRHQTARILLVSFDADGRPRWNVAHVAAAMEGTRGWHAFRRRFVLSPAPASLRLMVHHGGVAGTMEVEGLAARPQRINPSVGWVFAGWGVVWAAALLTAARRLRLPSRRGGTAVMAAVAAIVAGMLVPDRAISAVESYLKTPPSLPEGGSRPPTSDASATRPAAAAPAAAPAAPAGGARTMDAWRRMAADIDLHRAGHLVLFAILAMAAGRCFGIRLARVSPDGRGPWRSVGGLALFALAAEQLQWLTLSRTPKLADASINLVGLAVGLLLAELCCPRPFRPCRSHDRIPRR